MFRRFRQMMFDNFGIKIASLILALAVYVHVYTQQEHVITLPARISVEDVPAGLTWSGELPSEVRVRVRGRGADLFKLRAQGLHAVIRLGAARTGVLQRPVTTGDVQVPADVDAKIESVIDPPVIALTFEPVDSASLPVRAELAGRPAEGMVPLGPPSVWPETVRVSGPAQQLRALRAVPTREIDLSGRSESVSESVPLRLPSGMRANVSEVTVRVTLVAVARRDLGPLRVALPAEMRGGWKVHPESVRVTLSGPQVLLESVNRASLHPRVSVVPPFEDEEAAAVDVPLPAQLKSRVSVDRIDPATVTLLRERR